MQVQQALRPLALWPLALAALAAGYAWAPLGLLFAAVLAITGLWPLRRQTRRPFSGGALTFIMLLAIAVSFGVDQLTDARSDQWQWLATPFLALTLEGLVRRMIDAVRPGWFAPTDA